MPKIRVTRTLVCEGEEEWVNTVLRRSYIRKGEFKLDLGVDGEDNNCSIEETDRVTERLD